MKTTEKPTDAATGMAQIAAAAAGADATTRIVHAITPGQWIRQGDLYLIATNYAVDAAIPEGWAQRRTTDRQLVPGTSRGARHCVAGDAGVAIHRPLTQRGALVGPLVIAPHGCTITHPEHAHVRLPAGVYATRYQRDFAAEEMRRVQD